MGSFMFDNAAHIIKISSTEGIRDKGSSLLRILKHFILQITCSTKILSLAILIVLLTSAFPICDIPHFPGGT